jgi:glucokinase
MLNAARMILCGDIGGTHTRLALFERGRPLVPVGLETYPSREARSLTEIVQAFVRARAARPDGACFGIAGPVLRGRVATTNLPWVIEAADLSAGLGGVPVFLLNDLEALAHGVGVAPPEALATINAGTPEPRGNVAVIAAGTGLGEAGILCDGEHRVPFASEGGHADFAPRSEREVTLLRHLLARYGHASYERILSGPGLANLFDFLRDVEGRDPAGLDDRVTRDELPAAITTAALAGDPPIAVAALELFVDVYGAEAGNLALKLKATGGVFVGGGIAPRILPRLTDGRFRDAFCAKGRFEHLLGGIPVQVLLDDKTGLWGAATFAHAALAGGAAA